MPITPRHPQRVPRRFRTGVMIGTAVMVIIVASAAVGFGAAAREAPHSNRADAVSAPPRTEAPLAIHVAAKPSPSAGPTASPVSVAPAPAVASTASGSTSTSVKQPSGSTAPKPVAPLPPPPLSPPPVPPSLPPLPTPPSVTNSTDYANCVGPSIQGTISVLASATDGGAIYSVRAFISGVVYPLSDEGGSQWSGTYTFPNTVGTGTGVLVFIDVNVRDSKGGQTDHETEAVAEC